MHGYLSRDGLPPKDLLEIGRREVQTYGGTLLDDSITDAASRPTDQGTPAFELARSEGPALRARRVLVATGLRDVIPEIKGAPERWGRDFLHCPYCHGYEVRDQPLAVIGGSAEAVQHALLIRQWSSDVVLLTHGEELTPESERLLAARGVPVERGPVERLVVQEDQLASVELSGGRQVPVKAAFVRPSFVPNDALLSVLGCERDGAGWVVTDPVGRTSVAGVWAAGNVVDPRAQVITAAGQGSSAAIALNADLIEEDIGRAFAARA
jgi:thioredoxin reductase